MACNYDVWYPQSRTNELLLFPTSVALGIPLIIPILMPCDGAVP